MMRSLAALLMLVTLAAHGEAATLADVEKQGAAKVVITSSSPPHGFLDAKTNSLKGIMFEVAQAIAADWGVKAEFTEVPFGALIPTLTSKRAAPRPRSANQGAFPFGRPTPGMIPAAHATATSATASAAATHIQVRRPRRRERSSSRSLGHAGRMRGRGRGRAGGALGASPADGTGTPSISPAVSAGAPLGRLPVGPETLAV